MKKPRSVILRHQSSNSFIAEKPTKFYPYISYVAEMIGLLISLMENVLAQLEHKLRFKMSYKWEEMENKLNI